MLAIAFAAMTALDQERVECSLLAAQRYNMPAPIMLAVTDIEGGAPGTASRNSNGTFDVGALQFNTAYLTDLEQYGITAEHVAQEGCYPYFLAAWRISNHINSDSGDLFTRAANYHSRTEKYNRIYSAKLKSSAEKWRNWIGTHSITVGRLLAGSPDKKNPSRGVAEVSTTYRPRGIYAK